MLPPVGIEPRPLITDSKSNSLLSELVRHVLLRSLNFYSCTTWFLDFDDLVRINKVWLYKEPKVSVLQVNAKLVQKVKLFLLNKYDLCNLQTSNKTRVQNVIFIVFSDAILKVVFLYKYCNVADTLFDCTCWREIM